MRPDLIARYAGERLPRYTSYPTAPHFSPAVSAETYAGWLATLPADTAASLYVHVPFCRRMCWYCGCNTAVTMRDEPIFAYAEILSAEIALVAAAAGRRLPITHLHFGGGTPTILPTDTFAQLMSDLRAGFTLSDDTEVAIEIDPRTLTPEMATALGEAGVSRASLGVQSLDPVVQKAIGRVQSVAVTAEAIRRLRQAGIDGINIDLVYGLPHQTVESCIATVETCLALNPDRFAVFGYAHVPSRRIGLDHYALPADPMAIAQESGALHRNFQGYTTDAAATLIGLGASAIGRLPQGYVQNEPTVKAYTAAIRSGRLATCKGFALTPQDRLRGELIERLMCDFRVDVDAVCRRHRQPVDQVADAFPALDRLAADGIVRRDGGLIEMQPEALTLVRAVAASFDSYLPQSTRTHSPAL
jgi:oxygen-independent coproporphyrinogen-3 oxidase